MSEDTPRKQMLLQTMLVGSLAKHLADKASGEKNEEASTETLSYSKREFKAEKFTRIF